MKTSLTVGLLMCAAALGAQEAKPTFNCFRAQPLAKCEGWTVYEVRMMGRLEASSHTFQGTTYQIHSMDLGGYATAGVGYMRNTDSTHAVGGIATLGGGETGVRLALEARRRTWLDGGRYSFDVGGGFLRTNQQDVGNQGTSAATGITAHTSLGIGDVASVMVAGDLVQNGQHTSHAVHAGVQLNSWGALTAAAIAATGFALLLIALSHTNLN